ncbi:MAG: hypothetical protein GF418_09750 [Chitinivibrionales bacterium]|nr:hypothetical protein [Chitinivibrionales bacterium]MBD3395894.1 hypothetical protein [Chitinivibrionales bacterium]
MKNWIRVLSVCFLALAWSRCSTDPVAADDGGSWSEVEARLAYANGAAPDSARVYLLPDDFVSSSPAAGSSGSRPDSIVDSTVADDRGNFMFAKVRPGIYVVEAFDDSVNAVRKSTILVRGNETKDLGVLTLKPTGRMTGTVRLTEGGDPQKILVVASGGNRIVFPDAGGQFVFDSLAEGIYDIRLLPLLLDYSVLDTAAIMVLSGHATDIGVLTPAYTGVPSPRSLSLSYDSVKQFVTISWIPVDTGAIAGYNVYRAPVGNYNFVRITDPYVPKTDTAFVDTTPREGTTYRYRVTSLDTTFQYEGTWAGTEEDTVAITGIAANVATHALFQSGELVELTVLDNGSFAVAQNGTIPLVYFYRRNGTLKASWMPGEPAQLQDMYITHDDSGYVYVVNYQDDKYVTVFRCDSVGTVSQTWVTGLTYGNINGIATCGKHLYVNTMRDMMQRFDMTDTTATAPDSIPRPAKATSTRGLVINPSAGLLYTRRSSIVFTLDTAAHYLGEFTARQEGRIAVRRDGLVFVAHRKTQRISVYDPQGEFLAQFGVGHGSVDLGAIAFGADDTLYVLAKDAQTLLWELRRYEVQI